MEDHNNDNQINIELTDDVASGVYSNLAIITHSPGEFVTDFIQLMPGLPKGKVKSRIIMTPQNAKRLLGALADNIQKYEQAFGVIEEIEPNNGVARMNFGTPTTKA
ncbi:MAG TPA: DUF3467 domain-containing protein [Taishania sp.]|nr:DUF3467 domain-containing protein [Taishania sp.]HNS42005.1 DUF3467 domain-containing protein [Taishania sp.]